MNFSLGLLNGGLKTGVRLLRLNENKFFFNAQPNIWFLDQIFLGRNSYFLGRNYWLGKETLPINLVKKRKLKTV
jgi:hypothetical protein